MSDAEEVEEPSLGELVHLNGHEASPLPCLCKRCFNPEKTRAEVEGVTFLRSHAVARGRVLYYWIPAELEADQKQVRRAVVARMEAKLRGLV